MAEPAFAWMPTPTLAYPTAALTFFARILRTVLGRCSASFLALCRPSFPLSPLHLEQYRMYQSNLAILLQERAHLGGDSKPGISTTGAARFLLHRGRSVDSVVRQRSQVISHVGLGSIQRPRVSCVECPLPADIQYCVVASSSPSGFHFQSLGARHQHFCPCLLVSTPSYERLL